MEGAKLKRCGVQKGVPDLMVPIPSGSYHGLFLELKRVKGSRTSDEQVFWLNFLRQKGYYADIAHGFDEAQKIILDYIALDAKTA